ncbi:MAG: nucleoside triphosphate pyrophosphohydrolase [Candidatus Lindowbacteria bacterium]|nr:nucleoside triphosphate pyrophosphohydrolase [Candidatus Lindowbacteria bacterium]
MTDRPRPLTITIANACAALYELALYLRSERGCSWDRAQNLDSMNQCLRDESEELGDSIRKNDPAGVSEEWGDVFFILMMLAVIAEETGQFRIEDALRLIEAKMIRRHPHVFGSSTVNAVEDIIAQWDSIKSQEKSDSPRSLMDSDSPFYSALKRAHHVQKIAAEVGFDWPDIAGILEKIEEETTELREALASGDAREAGAELGDLLFSCVNLARFVKLDAETLLNATVDKFVDRFKYIESELRRIGKTPRDTTLAEMDVLWEKSKKRKDHPAE